MTSVTIDDVRLAEGRIRDHVHKTPVLQSTRINELIGAEIYFKCENFQKVGAFKARGACNAVFGLAPQAAAMGVVTHSSGNHGAALAWAARKRAIPATVVVPENAPAPKRQAIAGYGAEIVPCAPTLTAREQTAARLIQERGLTLVHPFDNDLVIAGQGTTALELLADHPTLDALVVPVGGGGLLAGTAIAAKALRPQIQVFAGEPQGADDAYRSFTSGQLVMEQTPNTICDGLRTTLCDRTFSIIRTHVDAIGLASEAAIVRAMRLIWEQLKIIVEPSCCPPLAAIMDGTLNVRGRCVGIILTGGNVDLDRLPWQN